MRKLSREIHKLDMAVGRKLWQQLAGYDCEGVSTGTHCRVIRYLSEHLDTDVYQRDVEKEFGITRSTASRVLTLMEEKGLIQRQSVEIDARLKKLTLTPKAQCYSKLMMQNGRSVDQQLLKGFTSEEEDQLFDFLGRMYSNLTKPDTQGGTK